MARHGPEHKARMADKAAQRESWYRELSDPRRTLRLLNFRRNPLTGGCYYPHEQAIVDRLKEKARG